MPPTINEALDAWRDLTDAEIDAAAAENNAKVPGWTPDEIPCEHLRHVPREDLRGKSCCGTCDFWLPRGGRRAQATRGECSCASTAKQVYIHYERDGQPIMDRSVEFGTALPVFGSCPLLAASLHTAPEHHCSDFQRLGKRHEGMCVDWAPAKCECPRCKR